MTTISINEKFNFSFVASVRDYERDLVLLRRLGFKPEYWDITKENYPLLYASGRPEVIFMVPVKNVTDAALITQALRKSK
jgi:hypothetical protein